MELVKRVMLAQLPPRLRSGNDTIPVRRGRQRTAWLRIARMRLDDGSVGSVSVGICDICPGGIGLHSPYAVQAGEQIMLIFEEELEEPLRAIYEVVHCRSIPNAAYSVGAKLVCVIDRAGTPARDGSAIDRVRRIVLGD